VAREAITVQDAAGERSGAELVDRTADGSLAVRWPDGRRLLIAPEAIDRYEGHDVHLAVRFEDLGTARPHDHEERIPLIEEEAVVEKHARPTATVRVRTKTHEREEDIDEVLTSEIVDVKRVPVERYVDAPAPVREEGDTTIVSVHEEVLVVEKRLLLKEELHLTTRKEERRETHRVSLRGESAEIERTEPDEA
jgi:stress response protein YsnF